MRTLLLEDRAFSCVRTRAVVIEMAARRRGRGPRPPPMLVLNDAPGLLPGYKPVPTTTDPATLEIGRVVIAGIFHRRATLELALARAAPLVAAGAALEVTCLTLEGDAATARRPAGVEVLDAAPLIETREHHTADLLLLWRVAAPVRVDAYAERTGVEELELTAGLPEGPLLGLSMVGSADNRRLRVEHAERLRERLAPFRGWTIVPMPIEMAEHPTDDLPETLDFAAEILPGSPVLLPELRDAPWRRQNFRLQRMRALIRHCAAVVASQDLPAAIAIGHGVPVLGIALGLGAERRIVSCMAALANELPAGSDLLWLGVPRYTTAQAR